MLSVNVEIIGDKSTIGKLSRLKKDFSDWSLELRTAGQFLKSFYQDVVFATEGAIFGETWKPLNPQYDLKKRTEYPGRGTLVRTGKMQKAYKLTTSKTYAKLENTSSYAKFHQFGTSRMPARVMIKLDETRKNEIIKVFQQGIANKLRKALS